ncbi:HNH endonuclease [Cupriavidus sp. CV2]|uniref:HNH endonuclease n=1 Tax=Cupriavidus ulmosensis TaxID=3065913 RepID=UPI00296B2AC4|nr:HNH endonuclease [Cupriavidus sp. CV2]MDW3684868.1 HNH endonuclease [Cupriavidus sp. CV2]
MLELDTDQLREVPGFDGLYSVTRDGRIWSAARTILTRSGVEKPAGGKWLKPGLTTTGYLVVRVLRPGENGTMLLRVHRAVALAWVENDAPDVKDQVNHKNGVKTDNRDENLEWCTRSENGLHAYRTGLKRVYEGAEHFGHRLKEVVRKVSFEDAAAIRDLRRAGAAVNAIAKQYRVSRQTVSGICNNRTYLEP